MPTALSASDPRDCEGASARNPTGPVHARLNVILPEARVPFRTENSLSLSLHPPFPVASYLYLCRALAAYHIGTSLAPTNILGAPLVSHIRPHPSPFLPKRYLARNGKGSPNSRCVAVVYLCVRVSFVAWLWVSGYRFLSMWRLVLSVSCLSERSERV